MPLPNRSWVWAIWSWAYVYSQHWDWAGFEDKIKQPSPNPTLCKEHVNFFIYLLHICVKYSLICECMFLVEIWKKILILKTKKLWKLFEIDSFLKRISKNYIPDIQKNCKHLTYWNSLIIAFLAISFPLPNLLLILMWLSDI